MVHIVDSLHRGEEHFVFNAACLSAVLSGKNNAKVKCYFSWTQFNKIREECRISAANSKILVIEKKGINLLLAYIISSINDIRIFLKSKKRDTLIYFALNPLSHLVIGLLNNGLRKKIVFFCHGELEFLIGKVSRYKFPTLLIVLLMKKTFFISCRNQKYIVLGDNIRNNMSVLFPRLKMSNWFSIEHPLLLCNTTNNDQKEITITMPGLATRAKNSHYFFDLAKRIQEEKSGEIIFSLAGCVTRSIQPYVNGYVDLSYARGFLLRETYKEALGKSDYLCFFYPSNTYKLTASGAILDCFVYRKPVIALSNDYFLYLFSKYGTFGYLVNNFDQLVELVSSLKKNDRNYISFLETIDAIRKMLCIENTMEEISVSLGEMI
jgi:hypothetical protein